ncbi:MAG: 6-hydroxymethylpterin diphosphokinase MptE-like protein [Planctomycetota bacterium]|jgi:hypothetical protein
MEEVKTYKGLVDANPLVKNIISQEMADKVFQNNDFTVGQLSPVWQENLKKNLKLYKKHGSFFESFRGWGRGKAVIAVGAGPSFNKNKHILKKVYELNCQFPVEKQPFIIIASNKMFKPLLEMGIFPHFTLLIDAGEVLYPQLCEKIPHWAAKSILVTGLNASNKILSKWDRRGGELCFYLIGEDQEKEYFKEKTNEDPEPIHISQGGSVLNTIWILSHRVLDSEVFIMIGNDLGYKLSNDKKVREESFYSVGDYRTNILNKRDEAKSNLAWMGYNLYESSIVPGQLMYDLAPMAISGQLWISKTWLEVQATLWAGQKPFKIVNASEAGTLGVLYKSYEPGMIKDRESCYLIDKIIPKNWETTTLARACEKFVEVKRCAETHLGVVLATG